MTTTSDKPELLSPAGSLEAFFAAMESGADAVYCGLKEFSARAKAKNFSLHDLEGMNAYARERGRRIYVTLNTLVKERELPALVDTLSALETLDVGGVILQDLAVWRLAREHFPGIELHASTQMTVHNAAGVKMLERMGFTRAVLARELSLEEIAAIRRQTQMELEHFIHGALCFSYSGQCYFSSWLGGKSGNRGRCAQPCRRRYRHRQQEGYYFSTNDLSAIDLLPDLAAAGVVSFKIEGRMKSAEYVANVVGAYRRVLDAPQQQREETVREAKEMLKQSFGRTPTRGFLPGGVPSDIATPSLKGATGRFLGEVARVHGSDISFTTRDGLHVGDRLRVQPRSDQAGTAFTIKSLRQGRKPVKRVAAGSQVTVPSPFRNRFQQGDTVFKVSSEQAFTMSEAACRRRLGKTDRSATALHLRISMPDNATLAVAGEVAGESLERRYPVETHVAREKPLSAEILRGVFGRTGGEPFQLESLQTAKLPPLVIPPSRLKEIRRDYYRELREATTEAQSRLQRERLAAARDALLPAAPPDTGGRRLTTVVIRDLRDAHILNDPEVDRIVVPLTAAAVGSLPKFARRLYGREGEVVWDIPFILIGEEWERCRARIRELLGAGFSAFRLNNIGHFPLFDALPPARLIAGYRLFTLNHQAALAWKDLGTAEVTLYIEDDRENLADLLRRPFGLPPNLTIYGSIPLITSRIPIRKVRPHQPVVSDRGDPYRVNSRDGQTVLSSETDFSLLAHREELQKLGCRRFAIELDHVGPFSPTGKKVLEALRRGGDVSATSKFNYEMGME